MTNCLLEFWQIQFHSRMICEQPMKGDKHEFWGQRNLYMLKNELLRHRLFLKKIIERNWREG